MLEMGEPSSKIFTLAVSLSCDASQGLFDGGEAVQVSRNFRCPECCLRIGCRGCRDERDGSIRQSVRFGLIGSEIVTVRVDHRSKCSESKICVEISFGLVVRMILNQRILYNLH